MGALTIAFDTTIVGALALPWVLLVIRLFFLGEVGSIAVLLRWVKRLNQPAVAGVLLFAVTYTLGSALSRIAQDFFNDDDLYIQFPSPHVLLRVGVIEDRILTSVYCRNANLLHVAGDSHSNTGSHALASSASTPSDPVTEQIQTFRTLKQSSNSPCRQTLRWAVYRSFDPTDQRLNKTATDIFGLQENALMEKGGDFTVRLRQLHDQVMVLRGAAFNGVIAFSLCLFAWGARVRCEQPRSALRWILALVPGLYLLLTMIALLHHFWERAVTAPPYMEFTLLLLGLVGALMVWTGRLPGQASGKEPGAEKRGTEKSADKKEQRTKRYWQKERWPRLALFSGLLTLAGILGWWSTEVFYAGQVIYSYDSQATALEK